MWIWCCRVGWVLTQVAPFLSTLITDSIVLVTFIEHWFLFCQIFHQPVSAISRLHFDFILLLTDFCLFKIYKGDGSTCGRSSCGKTKAEHISLYGNFYCLVICARLHFCFLLLFWRAIPFCVQRVSATSGCTLFVSLFLTHFAPWFLLQRVVSTTSGCTFHAFRWD